MEDAINSDEMLEDLVRRSEIELIPKLRKKVQRFVNVFNHSKMQNRLTSWLRDYSQMLDNVLKTGTVYDMMRAIRELVAFLQERFSPILLLEFMQESGFFALVHDDRFKFLDEDETLDKSADRLIDLLENGFKLTGQKDGQRAFDEYIETWSSNQVLMARSDVWIESQIDAMKKDAVESEKEGSSIGMSVVNDIKRHFEPLRPLLVGATVGVYGAAGVAGAVGLGGIYAGGSTGAAVGLIFGPIGSAVGAIIGGLISGAGIVGGVAAVTNRTAVGRHTKRGGTWFDDTAKFLIGYIMGDKNHDEVQGFIKREELDCDFNHFQDKMGEWVAVARGRLGSIKGFIIPLDVVLKEVDRLQKFCYAVILNKPEMLSAHSAAVDDLIRNASEIIVDDRYRNEAEQPASIFPCVSFGQLELGNHKKERLVEFKFVLPKGSVAEAMVDQLKQLFDAVESVRIEGQNGTTVVVIKATIKQNVAAMLASQIKKLSDLSIRAVLVGNLGFGGFRHAMNPQFNRIYSVDGEEKASGFIPTRRFILDRGGEPYFAPIGWRRYAIDVGKTAKEFEREYGDWPIAYHGTSGHLATSILIKGMMASEDGVYIDEVNNKPEDENIRKGIVYLSPSIEYCGHPRYALIWKIKNYYVQMVLQLRVKKSLIYAKRPGTIPGAESCDPPIDPNFADNNSLEWLVKWPPKRGIRAMEGILIYGIMLRVSIEYPAELKQNSWWQKSRNWWAPTDNNAN